MSAGGEMPQGPNMAALTSMMQGGMSDAAKQMWLCSWLPVLDFKPFTPITEMVPFFTKQMLPGAGACKLLPSMPAGFLAKLFGEVFKEGFSLEQWASDLQAAGFSEEQIEALMQTRSSGISAADGGASVSIQALGTMNNVAMAHAAMEMGGGGRGA